MSATENTTNGADIENTTNGAGVENLTNEADPAAETEPATTGPEPEATPDREAARYRKRLRETEARLGEVQAERDALAGRLVEHDRSQVVVLAEQRLADGNDLLGGVGLDALRDPDTGRISPDRVALAVADLLERKPHYGRALRSPNPGQAAPLTDERPGKTWADLLAGGGR